MTRLIMPSATMARRASLISRRSAGFFSGSKQSSPEPSQLTQAFSTAVRLRMLVGGFRFGQFAGEGIDVIMALAGSIDAVGPVQPGVEPLRRIRRHHLLGQHVAQLVGERAGVLF